MLPPACVGDGDREGERRCLLMHSVSRLTFPSKLGFGTGGLGTLYRDVSEREAAEVLAEAYEAGFRYFDTSPFYGHGLSELRLGSFLRTVPRESVMVSTKAGRYLVPPYGEKVDYGWWAAPLRLKPVFDYSYRRGDAFARTVGQSDRHYRLRSRLHPRRRPLHPWRGFRAAVRRGGGGVLSRARRPAQGWIHQGGGRRRQRERRGDPVREGLSPRRSDDRRPLHPARPERARRSVSCGQGVGNPRSSPPPSSTPGSSPPAPESANASTTMAHRRRKSSTKRNGFRLCATPKMFRCRRRRSSFHYAIQLFRRRCWA